MKGVAEVVKMSGLVRVTMRSEVNSIPEPRNCVLEITELPEALKTSEKGVAEVVKTAGLSG
jgi:hypothetical protein